MISCLLTLFVLLLLVSPVRADVDFDGSDVLNTGLPLSTFISGATGGTVMAWMHVQGTAPDTGGYCWQGAALSGDDGGYWALGRSNNTTFCGFIYDGADRNVTSPSSLGWHHLGLRVGGGTLSLWVDGVLVDSTASGAPNTLTFPVFLGASAENYSVDRLTEILYFNTYLSDAEMARHGLSRVRLVPSTTPTGHWALDECAEGASGDGVTFRDKSGNGRHATGDNGGNNLGLTCRANSYLAHEGGGVQ